MHISCAGLCMYLLFSFLLEALFMCVVQIIILLCEVKIGLVVSFLSSCHVLMIACVCKFFHSPNLCKELKKWAKDCIINKLIVGDTKVWNSV